MKTREKILVCGAGGYVGSKLIESLIVEQYEVIAFDTFWYYRPQNSEQLEVIAGDLCSFDFTECLKSVDQVIMLAAISNDPSFDLNPELSKKVNYDATIGFYQQVCHSPVKRFIFASSSSVYGIRHEPQVTEDLDPRPLTSYALYKAMAEKYFLDNRSTNLDLVMLRPATLCGPSPRLRLDLVTNLLSAQAFYKKTILIHGGSQYRPQLNLKEMIRAYQNCLSYKGSFGGEIFNVGEINYTVREIADLIVERAGFPIDYKIEPVIDNRSYRINSDKYYTFFNTTPEFFLKDAISDLMSFFAAHPDLEIDSPVFHNVKFMKQLGYE